MISSIFCYLIVGDGDGAAIIFSLRRQNREEILASPSIGKS